MLFDGKTYESPAAIANELDLSANTVIGYINSGLLKAHKFGGRYRITQEQFDEFLQDSLTEKKAATGD